MTGFMKFALVATVACKDQGCPSLYRTDRGSYLVVGGKVPRSDVADLDLPDDEGVVEVPESLVDALVNARTQR